jgi:hypothetical protein
MPFMALAVEAAMRPEWRALPRAEAFDVKWSYLKRIWR